MSTPLRTLVRADRKPRGPWSKARLCCVWGFILMVPLALLTVAEATFINNVPQTPNFTCTMVIVVALFLVVSGLLISAEWHREEDVARARKQEGARLAAHIREMELDLGYEPTEPEPPKVEEPEAPPIVQAMARMANAANRAGVNSFGQGFAQGYASLPPVRCAACLASVRSGQQIHHICEKQS